MLCRLPVSTCLLLLIGVATLAQERVELVYQAVPLPAAPASVLSTDLDLDGLVDLAVVVAYSEWDQIGLEGEVYMDEVDGLVEMLTIVPALFERRELVLLRGLPAGGFELWGDPLTLDSELVSLMRGPSTTPLLGLTADELLDLRPSYGDASSLERTSLFRQRSIVAGVRALLPALELVMDLDGDGAEDVLFPGAEGGEVLLSGGLSEAGDALHHVGRVEWPRTTEMQAGSLRRLYPLARARDVDGDSQPDLVLTHPGRNFAAFWVARGLGGGRFVAPVELPSAHESLEPIDSPKRTHSPGHELDQSQFVYFADLDGDGRAEYVSQQELAEGEVGWRQELRDAKRPPRRYRVHDSGPHLEPLATPKLVFEATGYAFEDSGDEDLVFPGGVQDLDGDGRLDLVSLTLDFSLLQAVRIMATKSLSIGLDFHVFCQDAIGGFRRVDGLDLAGKFRLKLNDLRVGQLSQFAGDFDGDGRADFVQMGRGRKVTVHRGAAGCRYPTQPDLVLELRQEPSNLALVKIRDLDGDRRSDLLVIQPQHHEKEDPTRPVRLDLYLSRQAEP